MRLLWRILLSVSALPAVVMLWHTPVLRRTYAASAIQPFTIQQHYEVTGPHVGNAVTLEYRTIAVRSDGSRANVTREPRKSWVTRQLDFADGIMRTVYDDVQTFSTSQRTGAEQAKHLLAAPDPAADCVASVSGQRGPHPSVIQARETRMGFPTVKVLNGNNLTLWMAPALGCTALEHFVDWDPAQPGTNTSRLAIDTVQLGEPDATLFTVSAEYSETPPSQAMALHLRFGGVPESAVQKLTAQAGKNDEFYFAHRPVN